MQCLQYVFYSLLSLQKHRVCVKWHQNNLQISKIIQCRDRTPPVLDFLDRPMAVISQVGGCLKAPQGSREKPGTGQGD